MARATFKPSFLKIAGLLAAMALCFTLAPAIAFALEGIFGTAQPGASSELREILASLGFTLLQAFASTILALAVGIPGAYFVGTYNFRGRRLFQALAAVPFCLPPLLVVLGFIQYYGRQGWFTLALKEIGIISGQNGLLYSFWGLVLVHAFYNFPLVIHNVGSLWSRLPRSRQESARVLGASSFKAFATGTLPQLSGAIAHAAGLIFLFCFFSFTIVLVFGSLAGSTLEVGIYRAIRFSNDAPKALMLAIAQTSVAFVFVALIGRLENREAAGSRDFGRVQTLRKPGKGIRVAILVYQAAIAIFFLGPLFSLVIEAFTVRSALGGLPAFGFGNYSRLLGIGSGRSGALPSAILNSLGTGIPAAFLAVLAGLGVAIRNKYGTHSLSALALLPLAISPAILARGWALLLPQGDFLLIILGQAAMAWPFVARSLIPAFSSLEINRHEAARTLGASAGQAIAKVDLGILAPSIASASVFALSITMGDANIPIVAGGGRYETLPLLVYRLTSAYRFSEACAAGLVLALFTSFAFFFKETPDGLP
jgi:thiamine transport system permease protein